MMGPCCTFPASEEDFVVALQPLGHVVGVEDGHLGGMDQTPGPHHLHTIHTQTLECFRFLLLDQYYQLIEALKFILQNISIGDFFQICLFSNFVVMPNNE